MKKSIRNFGLTTLDMVLGILTLPVGTGRYYVGAGARAD